MFLLLRLIFQSRPIKCNVFCIVIQARVKKPGAFVLLLIRKRIESVRSSTSSHAVNLSLLHHQRCTEIGIKDPIVRSLIFWEMQTKEEKKLIERREEHSGAKWQQCFNVDRSSTYGTHKKPLLGFQHFPQSLREKKKDMNMKRCNGRTEPNPWLVLACVDIFLQLSRNAFKNETRKIFLENTKHCKNIWKGSFSAYLPFVSILKDMHQASELCMQFAFTLRCLLVWPYVLLACVHVSIPDSNHGKSLNKQLWKKRKKSKKGEKETLIVEWNWKCIWNTCTSR